MINFNNLVRDLKVELSNYLLGNILVNIDRKTTKFVYDMVWGILSSGSSKISKIGRYLFEQNIHVTENRLTKNLIDINLESVKENYWNFIFNREAKTNPNILIDETDIAKPFGHVFEGLFFIHDGSKEGKPREKGFPVTGIVTLTDDNFILPLVTNIYSTQIAGYKSVGLETKRHLDKIFKSIKIPQTTTLSFDRGYDGSLYAEYIRERQQFYVIRAKEMRKYTTKHGVFTISQLFERYKGKYEFTYKNKQGITIHAKASAVEVTHKDFKEKFWIIIETIFCENDARAYLTNIDCSTKEGIIKALKAYRLRWRIEEYFRFIKQEYELEKYMIRSLAATNNLFFCINICVSFLTHIIQCNKNLWSKIKEVYQPLTDLEKEEMIEKKYGYHGIDLYRAKEGIRMILGHTKGRPNIPGRCRKQKFEQMNIFNQ